MGLYWGSWGLTTYNYFYLEVSIVMGIARNGWFRMEHIRMDDLGFHWNSTEFNQS